MDKCTLCDGDVAKIGWYGTSLYCEKCNIVHTPLINKDIYNENYRDRYLKYNDSPENEPLQKIRWNLVQHYCNGGRLCDVGCGVGAFLEAAPERFDVQGQDINPACVKTCQEKGFDMIERDTTAATGAGIVAGTLYGSTKWYDVITLWDVIEHFDDIVWEMNFLNERLKDGGYLIFSTPNFQKEYTDNIEDWHHYRPYEHVYSLSEEGIKVLADKTNFRLVEINWDESKIRQPDKNIITCVLEKK
jgi:2-polyprenyl-3-methyl-5-hydroxy-6-metoxy-1,4-benzoquinol methylase